MAEPQTPTAASPGMTDQPTAPIARRWRPGDDRADIPSMIRADQAGE